MNPLNPGPFAAIALIAMSIGFSSGWAVNGWRLNASIQKAQVVLGKKIIGNIGTRLEENKADEAKFSSINGKIEGKKNEEVKSITDRVNAAPRLRVGNAVCPASAPRAPEAESAGRSDVGNSGGGLVREDVDRDFKTLTITVEKALATGRECQAFIRENGLAP